MVFLADETIRPAAQSAFHIQGDSGWALAKAASARCFPIAVSPPNSRPKPTPPKASTKIIWNATISQRKSRYSSAWAGSAGLTKQGNGVPDFWQSLNSR